MALPGPQVQARLEVLIHPAPYAQVVYYFPPSLRAGSRGSAVSDRAACQFVVPFLQHFLLLNIKEGIFILLRLPDLYLVIGISACDKASVR